jgi:hypothetical protein
METPDDLTPRHVLQGQALMDYLVERAAERAKDAIIDRDERRKRIVTLVFSIIALVGISGLVSIFKIYVRSELDVFNDRLNEANLTLDKKLDSKSAVLFQDLQQSVKEKVGAEIADQVGAVKKILDEDDVVERYVELALDLPEKLVGVHQRGDKYMADKLAEVMQAAEQMAQIKQSTRRRRRFFISTRQIVDVMTRYNRETEINQLDKLFGDVMAADQELARKLVDHYGQLVIGSPQGIDAQPANMDRLQRYMRAAHDLGYPEKALIWSVFVEFKRNQFNGNSTTRSLLESTRDLADEDRAEFWYNLLVYTDANNWMTNPDQQGRELEQLMAALQRQYPEVTQVMQANLTSNEYLQTRLAALRERNPNWRQQSQQQLAPTSEAAAPETASEPTPATAEAPSDANTLRQ